MRLKAFIAVAVAVLSVLAAAQLGSGADADDGDRWYCYTHELHFYYEGGTPDLDGVEWGIVGYADGVATPLTPTYVGGSPLWDVYVDPEDVAVCDYLEVTQTAVRGDVRVSATETYIPVTHLDSGEYIHITFDDGYSGSLIGDPVTIHNGTRIPVGGSFADVPDDPSREGYWFTGWYLDGGTPYDPTVPVAESITVHAGWRPVGASGGGSGGGSGGTVTVNETHVVTFQVVPGLEYTVDYVTDDTVAFTVSVADGFILTGEPQVTATSGTITHSGMTFVLSGIDDNIVVTIDGDVGHTASPGDPQEPTGPVSDGSGFPWWILIVIILIIIATLAAYWYLRRDE